MSKEDFDKTQELIEQTNAEEAPVEQAFEILVSSTASEWPASCEGVKPVLSALQRMLYAAAAGKHNDFMDARNDMENAASEWWGDLFGDERPSVPR